MLTAVVQGLQDAGFQIAQVDSETGFVSANLEQVAGRDAPAVVKAVPWPQALMFPSLFGNKRHTTIEVTATVVDEGLLKRVRLHCRAKVRDGAGAVKSVEDIDAPQFLQDLFARIDKALFLAREKV